ncbi:hypothetical protein SEA_SKOG_80 [Gordonia phage Skog]|uniref:Uncharacterized protein n=1 Tax=Gordonia phage Skog TaxID=2704033 RepID=A0A6G6XJF6_9CAUD|nr:hypothetical protein KHQ85_gp080 [Gordonia phage Skog]QIG58232.1 hypothetical protein SEA_SKOG_80 [Gordonia phage Skog]
MPDYSMSNALNKLAVQMELANKIAIASEPSFPPDLRDKLIADLRRHYNPRGI